MCSGQTGRTSFKKSGKVFRRVLKKVGKVRVGLVKIGLIFSWGKTLVTCEKFSLFSPMFFSYKVFFLLITEKWLFFYVFA